MGWIDPLKGSVVALDTAPFIYFTEENATYLKMVDSFFEAVGYGEIAVVTSYITLLEVLVYPIKTGDTRLIKQYRDLLLKTRGITTLTFSQEIAEEAAKLRAIYPIRTPDAIQMATAIYARASFFLTNDMGLPSLTNLNVLVLDKLQPQDEPQEDKTQE